MNSAVMYPVIAYFLIKHVPFFTKRKRAVTVFTGVLVILIGFSRIYLGAHFPTDVLAGFSLGLCLVSLLRSLTKSIIRFDKNRDRKIEKNANTIKK